MILSIPVSSFADTSITTSSGTTEISGFGLSGGNPNVYAQSFTTTQAGEIGYVDVGVSRIAGGTVSDAVKVSIQANNAGNPSGTDLASGSIDQASLGTTYGLYRFVFTSTTTVTDATTYWVVLGRTGAYQGYPHGYSWYGETPQGYQNTRWHDGSSWTTGNNSMRAIVYIANSSGGGSLSSATSSEQVFNAWNSIYLGLYVTFVLSMISTIYIWRRFVC